MKSFLRPAILYSMILVAITLFTIASSPVKIEQSKINAVVEKVLAHKDTRIITSELNPELKIAILELKENKANHSNFDWVWDIHIIKIEYRDYDKRVIWIEIIRREYKKNVSRGKSYVITSIIDFFGDGQIEQAYRDFRIVDDDNFFIYPQYPEDDFIVKKWYTPDENKKYKFYEEELNYWSKILK